MTKAYKQGPVGLLKQQKCWSQGDLSLDQMHCMKNTKLISEFLKRITYNANTKLHYFICYNK